MQERQCTGLTLTAALLLMPWLNAQSAGATLEELVRGSDAVLRVRIQDVGHLRSSFVIDFTALESLKAPMRGPQRLSEDEHRYCGASLHGLTKGQECWLFLRKRTKDYRISGGSRGVVPTGPLVDTAIRKLATAKSDEARCKLLLSQLDSKNLRVREDAALALPRLKGLERFGLASAKDLQARFLERVRSKRTELSTLSLLYALRRVDSAAAAKSVWSIYTNMDRVSFHPVAWRMLVRELPGSVVARTAPLATGGRLEKVRVARLLGATHDAQTRPALLQLLQDRAPEVKQEAAAALLSLGTSSVTLESKLDKRSLERAKSLSQIRNQRRRFRAILKRR